MIKSVFMGAKVETAPREAAPQGRRVGKLTDVSARITLLDQRYTETNERVRFLNQFHAGPQYISQPKGSDPLSLYDQLLPISNERRLLQAVLASGQRMEAATGRELDFPPLPTMLDAYTLKKAGEMGMNLLTRSGFPLKSRSELDAVITSPAPSPVVDMYGKLYLTAISRGEVPIPAVQSGYALVDSSKAELATRLGIKPGATMDEIETIIAEKGEQALLGLGFKPQSGARVVLADAEMLLEYRACGYEGDFGEGITSTRVNGTDGHLVFVGNDIDVVDREDIGNYDVPPRLAIVFSRPSPKAYLSSKPPMEKASPEAPDDRIAKLQAASTAIGNPLARRRARAELAELLASKS